MLSKKYTTVTTLSKTLALILFIAMPFIGFYLGYSFDKKTATPSDNWDKMSPDSTVYSFYFSHIMCLSDHIQGLNKDIDCDYQKSPYVSAKLEKNLSGTYNSILCAQNFPVGIVVDKPVISGDRATVIAHHNYLSSGDNPITLTLDLEGNKWKISNIVCKK